MSFEFDFKRKEEKEIEKKTTTRPRRTTVSWIAEHTSTLYKELEESLKNAMESSVVGLERKTIVSIPPNVAKVLVKSFYELFTRYGEKIPSTPSIILLGPPGVGKSTIVKEFAREWSKMNGKAFIDISNREEQLKLQQEISECYTKQGVNTQKCLERLSEKYFVFLDLRLTEVEPTDLIGIPASRGNVAEYVPPIWAYIISHIPGVVFLDELSNVNRDDVLAAAYKILLDKSAGFVKFHPRTIVIAAGNLRTHAPQLVQPLPPPLVNRAAVFYVRAPSIDDWFNWMRSKLVEMLKGEDDETINDYLTTLILLKEYFKLFGGKTYFINLPKDDRAELNENFPTPRAWSHFVFSTPLSKLRTIAEISEKGAQTTSEGTPFNLFVSYISSFVGEEAAAHLALYFKYLPLINFNKIRENPSVVRDVLRKIYGETKTKDLIELYGASLILGAITTFSDIDVNKKIQIHEEILTTLKELLQGKQDVLKSLVEAYSRTIEYTYDSLKAFKTVIESHVVMNKLEEIKTKLFS